MKHKSCNCQQHTIVVTFEGIKYLGSSSYKAFKEFKSATVGPDQRFKTPEHFLTAMQNTCHNSGRFGDRRITDVQYL